MSRLMAPIVGALADAWSELRHHKLRVLLSLIGIAVSVGALTAVIALADFQRQFTAEQSDRFGGRVATITISASRDDGTPVDWDAFDERFERVAQRYDFSATTRIADGVMIPVQAPDGVRQTMAKLMDPAYPMIHRLSVKEGRWFTEADLALLASPVVITEALWASLGSPALSTHPVLTMTGDLAGTYPIIGVEPRSGPWDEEHRVNMLYGAFRDRVDSMPAEAYVFREIWVPPASVNEIGPVLAMDLRAGLEAGVTVSVNRSDWASQPGAADAAMVFEVVTSSIAGLVLLLGGLSLVNIQLVAMRQRIREIGVRRSFGATAPRIFTSVLLESVVATFVAGIVGIAIVVAIMRTPLILGMFPGLQDVPPFPIRAAVVGLAAAVAIGALAGLIPAIVAVRVKVIDTLRF
ncbi:MAG: ABC transporter permease [Microbacterium sp.]